MSGPLTVVLTGAECTGKTTLARRLAARFAAAWVEEEARRYAARAGRELTAADVEPIARGHLAAVAAARERPGRLLVLDTDLVSTVVYAEHYYGSCPAWIRAAAASSRADLYLLHRPDVPWVAEPRQRAAADPRAEQHARFRRLLSELGATVVEIAGDWAERERRAVAAIAERLGS
ncbi:MAG: AAA family ATPase [Thermoanaerobaculia bacterium]|nr:AAA family ATPase [Thermoanaerobaculia bacterium]MCZ7649723.1 AAA family ATPase [Thermoanaerobaculia bacterium]